MYISIGGLGKEGDEVLTLPTRRCSCCPTSTHEQRRQRLHCLAAGLVHGTVGGRRREMPAQFQTVTTGPPPPPLPRHMQETSSKVNSPHTSIVRTLTANDRTNWTIPGGVHIWRPPPAFQPLPVSLVEDPLPSITPYVASRTSCLHFGLPSRCWPSVFSLPSSIPGLIPAPAHHGPLRPQTRQPSQGEEQQKRGEMTK